MTSSESKARWSGAGFELFDAKLQPPVIRPEIVARPQLVERIDSLAHVAVVGIVAPAGYGKSTLLAQWAAEHARDVAWLSLDERDNDPEMLLAYLAAAVDRVVPLDPGILRRRSPGSHAHPSTAVRRLARAIAATHRPIALALDQVESIDNPECLDVLGALAVNLPTYARLVLASRTMPRFPRAHLRGDVPIVVLGVDDLALDANDARALITRAGVTRDDADIDVLFEHTEGWPVGLYLGALALKAGGTQATTGPAFSGDDRLVADYLRSEVLAYLAPDEVAFLTRTSVLERMCGPLCDVLLEIDDSSAQLRSLAASNLLLVALDGAGEWFRYHHLFRELLRAELERREPGTASALHRRAAGWAVANGFSEMALEHAQQGGDADVAAELILQLAQPTWAGGRLDTVLRWMKWLEAQELIEQYPAVAVHGALIYALIGRPVDADRWASAVDRAPEAGTLADGSTVAASFAYLRALLARDGTAGIRSDTRLALAGLSRESPYRPTMRHTEGMCLVLEGDDVAADPILAAACDEAMQIGAVPFAAMILAGRSVLACDRGDWAAAGVLSDQASATVRGSTLDDYWTSALVYATAARVARHRGDRAAAREAAARAARLRPLLTYALPVVSVQALTQLAHAYAGLGETAGAREVLRQARGILQQRPGLGILGERVDAAEGDLRDARAGSISASALTTAELRLLPFLQTHLTLPEIGDRVHVSRHTVKTQAISIYQKLGVSSRSEAIERLREIGLIEA